MSLITGLLNEFLGETGGIKAFLICHISRAKVSYIKMGIDRLITRNLINILPII
jgi:hypothetical protein